MSATTASSVIDDGSGLPTGAYVAIGLGVFLVLALLGYVIRASCSAPVSAEHMAHQVWEEDEGGLDAGTRVSDRALRNVSRTVVWCRNSRIFPVSSYYHA